MFKTCFVLFFIAFFVETFNEKTMNTIYLNTKQHGKVETIDQFTRGIDAPGEPKLFNRYVNDMIKEYKLSGINVYKSQKCTKDWLN